MFAQRRGGAWGKAQSLLMAALLACAGGCATAPNGDVRDPLEGFNRKMYRFNEGFDEAIGKPIATAYRDVLPSPVRTGVRNFFANLDDLFIGVNNLLQGKLGQAAGDWLRFGVNTVIGIFGFIDVASEMGLEKHNEDFGQTFGRWGVGEGAYLVWPMLGSSTVRDSVGKFIDVKVDPVWKHEPVRIRNELILARVTSDRAGLLDASRLLEEAALDKYVFQRDAYLQRRRSLILDGAPPPRGPQGQAADGPQAESAVPAEEAARLIEEPAVKAEPSPRASNTYEPRVPANYEAVLAASPPRR